MPAGMSYLQHGMISSALRTAAALLEGRAHSNDPVGAAAPPPPSLPTPSAPPPRALSPDGRLVVGIVRKPYRAASISGYMIWSSFINKDCVLQAMGIEPRNRMRARAILWRGQPMAERNRFQSYAREISRICSESERVYRSVGRVTTSEDRTLRRFRRMRIRDFTEDKYVLDGPASLAFTDELRDQIAELGNGGARVPAPAPERPPSPQQAAPDDEDDMYYIPLGARNNPNNPFQLERTPSSGPVVAPDADSAHRGLAELGKMTTDQVVDAITCVICMDKPRNVVFRACGHVCACRDCALQTVGFGGGRKCPVCRTVGLLDDFRLC